MTSNDLFGPIFMASQPPSAAVIRPLLQSAGAPATGAHRAFSEAFATVLVFSSPVLFLHLFFRQLVEVVYRQAG